MGLRLIQASSQSRLVFSSANIGRTPVDCYMLPGVLARETVSVLLRKLTGNGDSDVVRAVVAVIPMELRDHRDRLGRGVLDITLSFGKCVCEGLATRRVRVLSTKCGSGGWTVKSKATETVWAGWRLGWGNFMVQNVRQHSLSWP